MDPPDLDLCFSNFIENQKIINYTMIDPSVCANLDGYLYSKVVLPVKMNDPHDVEKKDNLIKNVLINSLGSNEVVAVTNLVDSGFANKIDKSNEFSKVFNSGSSSGPMMEDMCDRQDSAKLGSNL
ncbi:hypothetical protein L6452_01785 [Arctium lappa]|uniref:Uncharacterized protein n=1 Tax=Arctium lappa TaxID=4217 RepID=A0ACB9FHQ8_ARCLA|nr:hypothetical protein L6452_01785 [Arctium lappa]